jgi:hypothetical protein
VASPREMRSSMTRDSATRSLGEVWRLARLLFSAPHQISSSSLI